MLSRLILREPFTWHISCEAEDEEAQHALRWREVDRKMVTQMTEHTLTKEKYKG